MATSFSTMFMAPPSMSTSRGFATRATKGGKAAPPPSEEKGPFSWIINSITKEEQLFFETDPILRAGDDDNSNGAAATTTKGTTSSKKGTVSIPAPKKSSDGGVFGGLGGLFSKK